MKMGLMLTLLLFCLHPILTAQVSGWSQKESMPTQITGKYVKDGGSLVAVGNTIYAFRGNRSWEFYKYDATGDYWTQLCSIPYGRYPNNPWLINRKKADEGASLCYDGGNTIYATKGNGTTEFWKYEVMIDSWIARPFVPSERSLRGGTSITYYDGKVYLLAGEQSDYAPNFFVYNTNTDLWTCLTPAPLIPDYRTFRDGSCITQLGSSIYALKGGGERNYFWKYDIVTNSWTQMETLPLIHYYSRSGDDSVEISDYDGSIDRVRKTKVKAGGAMTTDGNVIYAIKGGGSHEFWQYTSVNGWYISDTIPRLNRHSVPRDGAALTYANGKIYLLKGNNTPEFWMFTPVTQQRNQKIR